MIVFRNLSSLLLVLLIGSTTYCQTLENVKASFDGEKMVITYDLGFTDTNQKFKVALFSSHDSYGRPLSFVTGDVGEAVHIGKTNRVVWDVRNTLPADFEGEITIKIKTSKVVAPASATKLSLKPLDKNTYKKGQSIEVRWLGGNPDEKVNIELFKGNDLKLRVAEKIGNTQHFTWTIPKGGVVGKEYILRISNAANATELSNSQFFAVKPKVPLLLKIAPVLVVGGVVAFLSGSKSPKDAPVIVEELPGPVKPQ
jgi:hypothetical protein